MSEELKRVRDNLTRKTKEFNDLRRDYRLLEDRIRVLEGKVKNLEVSNIGSMQKPPT